MISKSFSIFTLGLLLCASSASGLSETEIFEAGQILFQAGVKCPQRVWNGFSLDQKKVVINDNNQFYLWKKNDQNANGYDLQMTNRSDVIDNALFKAPFSFSKINSEDYIGVQHNMNGDQLPGASLAIHEAFHHYVQHSWSLNHAEASRAMVYPIVSKPGIIRAMIFENLMAAITDPTNQSDSLRRSAYWYKKFKIDFPDEHLKIAPYDISEGTANYVEMRAIALGRYGCDASEEQLKLEMTKLLKEEGKASVILAGQSYFLGPAAITLLEKSSSNWQKKIEIGITPLDLLLENLEPLKEELNNEVVNLYQAQAQLLNGMLDSLINPLIEKKKSGRFIPVSIPLSSIQGAYSTKGHFQDPKEFGTATILPDMTAVLATSKSKVQLKNFSIYEQSKNECGESQAVLFIPQEAVKENETTIQIDKADIYAKISVVPSKGKNKILCGQ